MKCQRLFSGQIEHTYQFLTPYELAERLLKVKYVENKNYKKKLPASDR